MAQVEIISAKEPRRRWSEDEKRRLVAAAFAPGAVVSHVAREHGVAPSCLFLWRKRFGESRREFAAEAPRLIPVLVDTASVPSADAVTVAAPLPAVITWADGMRLEVPAGYPCAALRALIAALRSAR